MFKKPFIYISLGLLLVSIILGALSITTINSSDYKYYEQQYSECRDGYIQCRQSANSSAYLSSTFDKLADQYADLMDYWEEKMDVIEVEALGFGIGAGAALIPAIIFFILALVKRGSKKVVPSGEATYQPARACAPQPTQPYVPQAQPVVQPVATELPNNENN